MEKWAIYRKTDKGLAEINGSARSVERRLRPLLILIDGNRTAMQVHSLVSGIGIREEDFDQLASAGFIEPIALPAADETPEADDTGTPESPQAGVQDRTPLQRYSDGKRYLCETAADKLGLRSFLFVLKIEKCSSAEELLQLLPEFEEAIARRFDHDHARQCGRIAESILKA